MFLLKIHKIYKNKNCPGCGFYAFGTRIYNLKTKELNDYQLEHGAKQMAAANNKIYILADWKIYIYDIEKIELIKSMEVNHMDNDFSYLSGMFVLEK